MPRCISRLGQRVGPRCAVRGVDARVRIDRVCAVRSRHDFWNHQGCVWRCGPRRDGDCDQRADADADGGRHRRDWLLHLPEPSAWPVRPVNAELEGFKKIVRENLQLDAGGALVIDFALETGAITEQVTVTAETPLLQSDVAIRKVVDSKDIEQLSFSGRNPIGVASLKPGVVGGSFNTRGFADLGNGGFNINGSRSDENNITVDGATAIRTRSSGAIIGIQNVDAIQEVQVLTANYMPEFGRSSGGQIRFVTKSGSNRFSGSASFFYQDDSLNANSWSRNRSTNPIENSGPAPFDQKQYGYSFGGPIPLGDVQGQAVLLRRAGVGELLSRPDGDHHRADRGDAATATSASCSTRPTASSAARGSSTIRSTGQPFPGNMIPAERLSPNGMAFLNAYPDADARDSARAPTTRSSPAPTRRISGRTTSGSTTGSTRRTTSATASAVTTGWRWTRSATTSRLHARTGSARTTRTRRAGRAR